MVGRLISGGTVDFVDNPSEEEKEVLKQKFGKHVSMRPKKKSFWQKIKARFFKHKPKQVKIKLQCSCGNKWTTKHIVGEEGDGCHICHKCGAMYYTIMRDEKEKPKIIASYHA